MSEMIDRIARAMRDHPDTTNQLIQGEAEHLARVAIEVMREPTQEQSTAGYQFLLADSSKNGYDRTDGQKLERMRGYYRAMIHAALEKQPA